MTIGTASVFAADDVAKLDVAKLKELLESKRLSNNDYVAIYSETPSELLLYILEHPDRYLDVTRLKIAERDDLCRHPMVVEKLIIDEDRLVRRCLAENANLPVNVFMRLVKDKESLVRLGLVQNSAVPDDILEILIHDTNDIVGAVATRALWMRIKKRG